jgi:hypothetical protein
VESITRPGLGWSVETKSRSECGSLMFGEML